MESPKGGPLTTFIMMLPLIVVPTIAMLKPADSSGLVNSWLSAATGRNDAETSSSDTDDADFSEADDEFAALFSESPAPAEQNSRPDREVPTDIDASLFEEAVGESLQDPFRSDFQALPQSVPETTQRSLPGGELSSTAPSTDFATADLLKQLQQAGATQTLWFSPGNQRVGFVAFFRPGPGVVSYRFEAIAESQAMAVRDVILQYQAWQQAQQR
ncbi:MAG: hypothetical protein R3C59_09005 [Planctomycetaceae bacterium]